MCGFTRSWDKKARVLEKLSVKQSRPQTQHVNHHLSIRKLFFAIKLSMFLKIMNSARFKQHGTCKLWDKAASPSCSLWDDCLEVGLPSTELAVHPFIHFFILVWRFAYRQSSASEALERPNEHMSVWEREREKMHLKNSKNVTQYWSKLLFFFF